MKIEHIAYIVIIGLILYIGLIYAEDIYFSRKMAAVRMASGNK